MLCATAGILYGAASITLGPSAQSYLAILLTTVSVAISTAHCLLGHVTAFRIGFVFLVLLVVAQLIFLVMFKISDPIVKRNARLLTLYGVGKLTKT